jgi:ParB-like chromosome segregation protein Spo0J
MIRDLRAIAAITVGARHRRDMGDLASLAKSIAEIGLLHPIVVNQHGELIAGARRLAAFRMLGRTEIPTRIVDQSYRSPVIVVESKAAHLYRIARDLDRVASDLESGAT